MGKVIGFEYDLALQVGVNAAVVYNELLFWSTKKGARKDGWIYKTYEEMCDRLPLSESTIRRSYKKLAEANLITTKIMRLDGTPVLHYKLTESETVKLTETKETVKLTESIYTVNNHKTNKADSENSDNSDVSFGADDGAVNVPAAAGDEPTRLLEYLISIINPKEKVIETRMRLVRGRLKEYSAREIALAGQVFAQSQWHKENKQMSVDNLLAPSKFGRWYSQVEDADIASDAPIQNEEQRRESDRERIRREQAEQMERNKQFEELDK